MDVTMKVDRMRVRFVSISTYTKSQVPSSDTEIAMSSCGTIVPLLLTRIIFIHTHFALAARL